MTYRWFCENDIYLRTWVNYCSILHKQEMHSKPTSSLTSPGTKLAIILHSLLLLINSQHCKLYIPCQFDVIFYIYFCTIIQLRIRLKCRWGQKWLFHANSLIWPFREKMEQSNSNMLMLFFVFSINYSFLASC